MLRSTPLLNKRFDYVTAVGRDDPDAIDIYVDSYTDERWGYTFINILRKREDEVYIPTIVKLGQCNSHVDAETCRQNWMDDRRQDGFTVRTAAGSFEEMLQELFINRLNRGKPYRNVAEIKAQAALTPDDYVIAKGMIDLNYGVGVIPNDAEGIWTVEKLSDICNLLDSSEDQIRKRHEDKIVRGEVCRAVPRSGAPSRSA